MTHPATAEGIYQALQTGVYAAQALAAVGHGQVAETIAFGAYERRCHRRFGRSFRAGQLLLKVIGTPLLEGAIQLGASRLVQRGFGGLLFPLARS